MTEVAQAGLLSQDSYVMQRLFIGTGEGFNLRDDSGNLLLMAREDHLSLGTYIISGRDGGIVGKTRPRGSISSHVFEMLDANDILLGSIGFDPAMFMTIDDEVTLYVRDGSDSPMIEIKGDILSLRYELAVSGKGDMLAEVGGDEQDGGEQTDLVSGPKDSYRIKILNKSVPTLILIESTIIVEQIAAQWRRFTSTMPHQGGDSAGGHRGLHSPMGPDFRPTPIKRVGNPTP